MTKIRFETKLGPIVAELFDRQAPRTVAHLLAYVDEGYYDGASFYRTVRPGNQSPDQAQIAVLEAGFSNDYYDRMLRGGFFSGEPYDMRLGPQGSRPCISVETTAENGLRHRDGVLSFGRCSAESVDDSFFICLGDQPELDYGGRRHPDGLGFSACGQVVSGMELVRAIHAQAATGQRLDQPVRIDSLRREETGGEKLKKDICQG